MPFGEYPELAAAGLRDTGTENYGGPIVTAGGLLFIGATNYDKKFRADRFRHSRRQRPYARISQFIRGTDERHCGFSCQRTER